jgi:DNA-binding LytR/AlgR family response regulator
VFVTAYEQYAVQAFEQGALDYLVKPFDESPAGRHGAAPAAAAGGWWRRWRPGAAGRAAGPPGRRTAPPRPGGACAGHLQWIKASIGPALRLIPVDEVAYLRSDEKYTLVAWNGGEAVIRKTIRELADELDPSVFVQIHRSVIVNLRHVAQVVRGANETADVHLRGRAEVLPVSRSYLHLFRQM